MDEVARYHPDLILLDIMMKKMNGLDMLQKLKADTTTRDIPVVVLSNVSDMRVINDAKTLGAQQCIIKSETEAADMVSLVKNVLAETGGAAGSP